MNNAQAELNLLAAPAMIALLCDRNTTDEVLGAAFGSPDESSTDIAKLRSVYDHGGKALEALEGISKVEAYRLYAALPIPLFYPSKAKHAPEHLTADEIYGVQAFQAQTAAYLISWELGIVVNSEARELLEPAHDRALVSERRYQMIRRMCELGLIAGNSPATDWILAEASECLLGLKAGKGKGAITADRTRYEKLGHYVRSLKGKQSANEPKQPTPQSFEEQLEHYSRWIDAAARSLAEEKTSGGRKFRKQYFKPYCDALTAWNSNRWNKYSGKLESVGIERRKPGPTMGRRYCKER